MSQSEWYEENGRLYHTWQRGLYMFPIDEVRITWHTQLTWSLIV